MPIARLHRMADRQSASHGRSPVCIAWPIARLHRKAATGSGAAALQSGTDRSVKALKQAVLELCYGRWLSHFQLANHLI